jgi:hypothetical protein
MALVFCQTILSKEVHMKGQKLSLNVLMVAVFITCFAVGAVHAQVAGWF